MATHDLILAVNAVMHDFRYRSDSAEGDSIRNLAGGSSPDVEAKLDTIERSEMTVSMATQYLCELAQLYSEGELASLSALSSSPTPSAPGGMLSNSDRLIPSPKRLLDAVQQVATTSGQLLNAVRSSQLDSADRLRQIEITGNTVKNTTDQLASVIQHGATVEVTFRLPNSSEVPLDRFSEQPPIPAESETSVYNAQINVPTHVRDNMLQTIYARAQIQSGRAELDELQIRLNKFNEERAKRNPELYTDADNALF
ncbi:unnamed protein product [Protopolystoma xenopodis]|uniref:I/LWEQ domain-containing protein n=1 Tax=Protopolystoma xenopodis TaxID=117903 RepID=A0A448WFJ2_9PLAT|nr:unnamed protein product [Protopolystoma xenopodis]